MDFSIAAAGTGLVVIDISPKALGPTRGLGAVLGRYALKEPGDCDAARHRLDGPKDNESQDSRHAIPSRVPSSQSHCRGLCIGDDIVVVKRLAEGRVRGEFGVANAKIGIG